MATAVTVAHGVRISAGSLGAATRLSARVISLSGTTLSVLEFDGTTQQFTVSPTTTRYFLDGKLATSAAVVAGLNVVVIGPLLGLGW